MSKKIRNSSKDSDPSGEDVPAEKPVESIKKEEKMPEQKKAPGEEKSSKDIKVSKSSVTYVGVAIIFFAIGFMVNYGLNPTAQIVAGGSGDGESADQFVFIHPQGCVDCESLEEVGREVASTLNIPFRTTGFDRQMDTPGYVLLYDGKFMTTAAYGSEDTLLTQLCQLTGNEDVCDEAPEQQEQEEEQGSQEVPKSERPVANAFVMSHCPYGTQFMKAYVPVIELLGEVADVELNFVHYLMHGEKEMIDNNNMYCVQEQGSDKLTKYLRCFLESQDSESCLAESGVDEEAFSTCLQSLEDDFDVTNVFESSEDKYPPYPVDAALAQEYGVRGSPTFVVNGQTVQVNRSPEAIKDAICSAFNTPPEECETELSSEAASPGFGPVGEGGGSDSGAQC